jgi:hypothetical protein
MKPDYVARLHRGICADRKCEYLDKVNYLDECAVCPNGHWGQYNASKCRDDTTPNNGAVPHGSIFFPYHAEGPGTELKKLLSKLGLKPSAGCKCNQRITKMNLDGIEWCEQNIPTILGWLKEEADRARLPFFELGAKIIVKRAISNAKRKVKS